MPNPTEKPLHLRKRTIWLAWTGGFAAWMLMNLILSCTSSRIMMIAPPAIAGAEFAGSESCVTCHEEIINVFPTSPHARMLPATMAGEVNDTRCESCHGAGSLHVNAGGGTALNRFIVNGQNTLSLVVPRGTSDRSERTA